MGNGSSVHYQVGADLVVSWGSDEKCTVYTRPGTYIHRSASRFCNEEVVTHNLLRGVHLRTFMTKTLEKNVSSDDGSDDEVASDEIGEALPDTTAPPTEDESLVSFTSMDPSRPLAITVVWERVLDRIKCDKTRAVMKGIFRKQAVRGVSDTEFRNVTRPLWVRVRLEHVVRALSDLTAHSSLSIAYEALILYSHQINEQGMCDGITLSQCAQSVAIGRHGPNFASLWACTPSATMDTRENPSPSIDTPIGRTMVSIYQQVTEDLMTVLAQANGTGDPRICFMPEFVDALAPAVLSHNGAMSDQKAQGIFVRNGIVETAEVDTGYVMLKVPASSFQAARAALSQMLANNESEGE